MMTRSRSYRDDLLESLQNPEEAQEYLNAALIDGNPEVFLLALKDVVDAQQSTNQVATNINLSEESLYKTLSSRGNLDFFGYSLYS